MITQCWEWRQALMSQVYVMLDVDGVLHPTHKEVLFVPACMRALARICCETSAQLVLSSMWREFPLKVDRLNEELAAYGIPKISSLTPVLLLGTREDAICSWLRSRLKQAPRRWIALDDMSLSSLGHHALRIDASTGLTEADADAAILRLSSNLGESPCASEHQCALCTRLVQEPSSPIGRALSRSLSPFGKLARGATGHGSPLARTAATQLQPAATARECQLCPPSSPPLRAPAPPPSRSNGAAAVTI